LVIHVEGGTEGDNSVPREILGPNRNEVTEDWIKMRNEEHHDLQSL
jgi:hypothetical protein